MHNFIRQHAQDNEEFHDEVQEEEDMPDDADEEFADDTDVEIRNFRDDIAKWMLRDYQTRVNATVQCYG